MKKAMISLFLALVVISCLSEVRITGNLSDGDMVNLKNSAENVINFLLENGIPISDSPIIINVPVGDDGSRLVNETIVSAIHLPSPQIERVFREYITIRFGLPWGEEALAAQVSEGITPYKRSLPLFFIEEEIIDKTFFHDVISSEETSLEKAIISALKERHLNLEDFNMEMIRWSLEKATPYLLVTTDACSIPLITSIGNISSNPILMRIDPDRDGDLYSEATIYTPYQDGLYWVFIGINEGAYLIPLDKDIPLHINVTKSFPVWIGLYSSNQASLPESSFITYMGIKPDLRIIDAKVVGSKGRSIQLNVFSEGIQSIRVLSLHGSKKKSMLVDGIPVTDGMNDIAVPLFDDPNPSYVLIEGLSDVGQVLLVKEINLNPSSKLYEMSPLILKGD